MKLRLQSTSARLRLSEAEVRELALNNSIEESVDFGANDGQKLVYEIVIMEDMDQMAALFENGRLTVTVPAAAARHWAESGDVALYGAIGSDAFRIVIEKDLGRRRPERA